MSNTKRRRFRLNPKQAPAPLVSAIVPKLTFMPLAESAAPIVRALFDMVGASYRMLDASARHYVARRALGTDTASLAETLVPAVRAIEGVYSSIAAHSDNISKRTESIDLLVPADSAHRIGYALALDAELKLVQRVWRQLMWQHVAFTSWALEVEDWSPEHRAELVAARAFAQTTITHIDARLSLAS